jgi:uncharacterized protein YbjT (DUF2867 family)
MGRTALVFGGTGLIGSSLIEQLASGTDFDKIKVFVRRPLAFDNPKITAIQTDFLEWESLASEVQGDALFCCLGTTIKKAGSQEKFRGIDFALPVKLAELAAANKVPQFLVVSSLGTTTKTSNFYLKTKAEMETAVSEISFENLVILRPSILLGKRNEKRFGESVGKVLIQGLGWLFFGGMKKYRGIQGSTVAAVMIKMTRDKSGQHVLESDAIQALVKANSF